jgi:RNA polymerase sigma factor (TIGR02999 family)
MSHAPSEPGNVSGDPQSGTDMLPLVYDELRQLAAAYMAQERPGQTLQATALVHEAYLRLVGADGDRKWGDRTHFFAAAAEAMRRLLIDQSRRRSRQKRGGDWQRHDLEITAPVADGLNLDMLALDEALTELARIEPRKTELVKLRYFCGMSTPQAADVLGISTATAERDWRYARAWLAVRLQGESPTNSADAGS